MFFSRNKKIKRPLSRKIINGFIYFGLGIMVAFLVFFAISQTYTFREWLREKVITTVNESTNGELSIEEIQGTIFTSLILNNTVLVQGKDTILYSEKIEVRTSPLKLLFKTIYFRKIELSKAKISLLKNETGELNISKLIESSGEEVVRDTTNSEFAFNIQVADLSLNDVEFNFQSTENKNSTKIYDTFNLEDLRLKNLNLSMDAFANVSSKEILLNINKFSSELNLNGFVLNNLSGNFHILNDEISVNGLEINTDRSNISLTAQVKDIPILKDEEIKIEDCPLTIKLTANKFNFDDLTNFIPATELLEGSLSTTLNAEGTLNDLRVNKLDVAFRKTHINLNGNLKNIPGGDQMLIDVIFSDTYFDPDDPNMLLRTIDIPVYADYGILIFDSLYFKGKPLQFNSGMYVSTERGNFDGIVNMDLFGKEMKYNIVLFTQRLDLSPVINIATNLNSHVILKGQGTSPENMNNELHFAANWSEIENRNYQNLDFKMLAADANLNYTLNFKSDTTSGILSGEIDFKNPNNPLYNIDAALYNVNISDIIPGVESESDLNISISAEGNDFDPDSLELFAVVSVDSSTIDDIKLDGIKSIVDIRKHHDGGRLVNVVSNLADITLTGNFSILDIVSLIEAEANLINDYIDYTVTKLNPTSDTISTETAYEYRLPDRKVDINYSVEFKDFELLSLFLGGVDLEIDGDINGKINRTGDLLSVLVEMDVNYFKYLEGEELYFISDMVLNTEVLNDFSVSFSEAFKSDIDLSIHQLFLTEKFYDISLHTSISENKLALKFNSQLNDYLTTRVSGNVELKNHIVKILLDSLFVRYNEFDLENKDLIDISYSNEQIQFNNFIMTHSPGDVELEGLFSLTNDQNLSLRINDISGKDLTRDVFLIPRKSRFDSNINLEAMWQGTAQSPLLDIHFTMDTVKVSNINIGSLISSANYENGMLSFNAASLDTTNNIDFPNLKVNGSLPIDLAILKSDSTISNNDVYFNLEANRFALTNIAGLVPYVKDLKGNLNSSINVSGTTDSLRFSGGINLDNISFTANGNNIKYKAQANLILDDEYITINKSYLKNLDGTKNGGTIYVNGKIAHKNFEVVDIDVHAKGQLKILGIETRAVNQSIFGDLTIATNDDLNYNFNNGENAVTADIIIKKGADVTISPTRSAFSSTTDKYIYEFKHYATELDNEALIDSLIQLSQQVSHGKSTEPSKPKNINLQLKINVEDEAKMVFVVSPEFQQNLTAYLGGNFEYSIVNDNPIAQGELVLLDGSKLEFIKPFEASGTVRFFDEINNPYLNVTATYQDYYLPTDSLGLGNPEKEVEIRVRLEGPLKDLNKNFMQQTGNISVYVRENSTSDFQLDATKTPSDAMMFIIVGKFTDDATSQDRNVAASTAASFAGSLIGTILNESFGDYVRSVRVQQVGAETKFSLIGKAGEVRYEIGGTSQVFQDITRANIKIEYPPISSLRNLVLRLQRRDPVQSSSTYSEMINEFGVKYRFDF